MLIFARLQRANTAINLIMIWFDRFSQMIRLQRIQQIRNF